MNFKCIPIVANVGGMPEVVGKNGLIFKKLDFQSIVNFINKSQYVFNVDDIIVHIKSKFDLKIRERRLNQLNIKNE